MTEYRTHKHMHIKPKHGNKKNVFTTTNTKKLRDRKIK